MFISTYRIWWGATHGLPYGHAHDATPSFAYGSRRRHLEEIPCPQDSRFLTPAGQKGDSDCDADGHSVTGARPERKTVIHDRGPGPSYRFSAEERASDRITRDGLPTRTHCSIADSSPQGTTPGHVNFRTAGHQSVMVSCRSRGPGGRVVATTGCACPSGPPRPANTGWPECRETGRAPEGKGSAFVARNRAR